MSAWLSLEGACAPSGTGHLLQQLVDPNFTHISPVNKPHPRLDGVISGSSRSLYAWRPVPEGLPHLHPLSTYLSECS